MAETTKTTRQAAAGAGAKVPADHLAEAEATNGEVTVEHDGFTFTFNPRAVTDMRLSRRVGRGDPAALDEQMTLVFGKQYDKVLDHIAEQNDGYVTQEEFAPFVQAVLKASGLGKQ